MNPRLLLALLLLALTLPAGAQDPPLDLGGVREEFVMIPMRDGVRLNAGIYRPPGEGPWPVLFQQRYAGIHAPGTRQVFARLAAKGYAVCVETFRGAQQSEGTFVGYRALGWGEKQDGYDTVEWLARQPWSTGKIGTFGGSQAGIAQQFLAVARPPHLVCEYVMDAPLSLFHDGYRLGGATRPERFKGMDPNCRDPADNRRLMAEWFRHPTYDEYWEAEDAARHFDRMNVPAVSVGGWYDFMGSPTIRGFVGRQHHGGPASRGRQKLVVGAWVHGPKGNRPGEMVYPENAAFNVDEHMVRWFDHYLKGVNNGIEREPAVRYYVMGATGEPGAPGNEWRTAADWPVPARDTAYYLESGGGLSRSAPGDGGGQTTFKADPLNPATGVSRSAGGARDGSKFEQQPDVRTFTTEVLEEPVEWTGLVRAELYVSSSAPDTDFIVRVSDVYPDGRSFLIIDYLRRARYREGFDREVFMKPGGVYKVAFDVGNLSQIFNRGHRIRIGITSTMAPFYEPNPNTGEPLTLEWPERSQVAVNTVHHNRAHASRIIAPLR